MANPKQYNSQTKHYQTSNQTKELTTPKAGQKKFSLRKFIIAVLVLILFIGVVPPIVHWITNFLPITQTKEKTTSSTPAKSQPKRKQKSKLQPKTHSNHPNLKTFQTLQINSKTGTTLTTLEKLWGSPKYKHHYGSEQSASWNKVQKGGSNASVDLQFKNNHAVSKSINNLKVTRKHLISKTDIKNLKKGTSKQKIVQQLGPPNDYTEYGNNHRQEWTYNSGLNGASSASCTLYFSKGLFDKAYIYDME